MPNLRIFTFFSLAQSGWKNKPGGEMREEMACKGKKVEMGREEEARKRANEM